VIGSIRRECLDHIVIFNERHLRRVMSSYVDYYQRARTHLSLDKDCPDPRPIMPRKIGKVFSPSLKSVVCIAATSASPPDSSQIPADQWLLGGRYALVCGSMNQTVFDRDQAELLGGSDCSPAHFSAWIRYDSRGRS
jgi:hypothetical protein